MVVKQWNKLLKVIIITMLIVGVVVLISPFLLSLFIGAILAVLVFPAYHYLLTKKWNTYLAATVVIVLFNLVILVPTAIVSLQGASSTFRFVNETIANRSAVSDMLSEEKAKLYKAELLIARIASDLGVNIPKVAEVAQSAITRVGTFAVTVIRNMFAQIPEFLLTYFIVLITMFFALVDHRRIRDTVLRYSLLSIPRGERLINAIYISCKSVILANVIAGGIQAVLIASAAYFTGAGDFFIVIFITFILSFIPVIGAAPVAFVLGVLAGFQHDYVAAIVMVIAGIVAGTSDNIVRPYVLSGAAETHWLLNLLTILGGVILFGLPGLFIGPLVLSLAVTCIPIYKEELDNPSPNT